MATLDEATRAAISTLADLAAGDSGGSSGARSVLLYAADTSRAIEDLASLSGRHLDAAIILIDRPWAIRADLIESMVPQMKTWGTSNAKERIREALAAISGLYWAACFEEQRAVHPSELGLDEGTVSAEFEGAVMVEDYANEHQISFSEAKDYI
jgi:hypothetical protein